MQVVQSLFSNEQLETLTLAVQKGRTQIPLTDDIKEILVDRLGLSPVDTIPCRIVTGDTPSHVDRSTTGNFDTTYIVYLNDAQGEFAVGDETYPIEANTAFIFSEGTRHEVRSANGSTRLMLGPMSEAAQPVGVPPGIYADGQTKTIYIKEDTPGSGTLSFNINNGTWNALTPNTPISINNTNTSYTLKVLFTTDITILDINTYFIVGTDNIQFGNTSTNSDGTVPTFNIDDSISGYLGLINNNNYSKVSILNINIVCNNETPSAAQYAGWIAQANFGVGATNNYIVNCTVVGIAPESGGGLVGSGAAANGGELTIVGCIFYGNILAEAGGIVGYNAGNIGGTVTVRESIVTCSLNLYSGGIFGRYAGNNGGTAYAINCFVVVAEITGQNGGGIFGDGAGANSGSTYATGCASLNAFDLTDLPENAGGIYGSDASNSTATNCYSTGNIVLQSGGIFGPNTVNCVATHCYTSGTGDGSNGIFADGGGDNPSPSSNNYSETGHGSSAGWTESNADLALTGIPNPVVGTTWTKNSGSPYINTIIGFTQYSQTNITVSNNIYSLINTESTSVSPGQSTTLQFIGTYGGSELLESSDPSFPPYFSFDGATGIISTTTSTPPGTYTFHILSYIGFSYIISIYTLTVTGPPEIPVSQSICCGTLAGQSNLVYSVITDVQAGNAMIAERSNPRFSFASYADYMKYKTALAFSR